MSDNRGVSDARVILSADSCAYRLLSAAVRSAKAVIFAGLPGVGKTLMLQQAAFLAHAAGRPLHLLQWDIARQSFDTPGILARYPEIDGTTHAAIRIAAGLWVRSAVARWAAVHTGDGALLLAEAPFVGNRFIELARREADAAEAFLASGGTRFIIPAPTQRVRRAIETMRAREMVRPRHAREAANAPPALLDLLMRELRAAGAALGVPGSLAGEGYDPDVYAAIYMRLLERRHVEVLPIEECLPAAASPYELGVGVAELRPAPAEVGSAMAQVEALGERGLQETVQSWFRSAAMGAPPARD